MWTLVHARVKQIACFFQLDNTIAYLQNLISSYSNCPVKCLLDKSIQKAMQAKPQILKHSSRKISGCPLSSDPTLQPKRKASIHPASEDGIKYQRTILRTHSSGEQRSTSQEKNGSQSGLWWAERKTEIKQKRKGDPSQATWFWINGSQRQFC